LRQFAEPAIEAGCLIPERRVSGVRHEVEGNVLTMSQLA
jgi:hypothetical protein